MCADEVARLDEQPEYPGTNQKTSKKQNMAGIIRRAKMNPPFQAKKMAERVWAAKDEKYAQKRCVFFLILSLSALIGSSSPGARV